MILADKIIELRKKNGLSQEELAEKMSVSRQSVSKWESALSTPDINRILQMADIFGVSTDYLLKDEIETEEGMLRTEDEPEPPARKVSLEEANEYLACAAKASGIIARGVFLIIAGVAVLIGLTALGAKTGVERNEDVGAILGVVFLLVFIAAAVVHFIIAGQKTRRFEFLEKENIDTAYGVSGMVNARKAAYQSTHTWQLAVGIGLCVVSPVPVVAASLLDNEKEWLIIMMTALLMLLVAAGVYLIVRTSTVWGSFQKLLEEGDYTRENKQFASGRISTIYWPAVTAGYLLISFLSGRWDRTWVIWPIAGIVYGLLAAIFKPKKSR